MNACYTKSTRDSQSVEAKKYKRKESSLNSKKLKNSDKYYFTSEKSKYSEKRIN